MSDPHLSDRLEAAGTEIDGLRKERDALALVVKLDGRIEMLDEVKRVMAAHDAALVKPLERKRAELAAALASLKSDCRKWAIKEGLMAAVEYLDGLDDAAYTEILAAYDAEKDQRIAELQAMLESSRRDCEALAAYVFRSGRDAEQRRIGAVKALREASRKARAQISVDGNPVLSYLELDGMAAAIDAARSANG